MARITDGLLGGYIPGLTIDRYQEIMQLPIAAFNGLNKPGEHPSYECAKIWTQSDRDLLAQWLAAAEEARETELGYHLAPKYIVGQEYTFKSPLLLNRAHLIAVGIEQRTTIESGVALTHSSGGSIIDPVVFTVDDGNTYTANDIAVYYPGEDVKIKPSSVSVSGTTVTIKIPRARLIKPELIDDREDHLYYDDDDNFLETVDVGVISTELEGSVEFVWYSDELLRVGEACLPDCSEATQSGCATLYGSRSDRISTVKVWPATFTDGVSAAAEWSKRIAPKHVRVSYLSGVRNSPLSELLTARYAHTLMPAKPCSCPIVEQYWDEDRTKLEGFTTPYGDTKGALNVWMFDSRRRIGIAATLP